jgi:hypothetical protein
VIEAPWLVIEAPWLVNGGHGASLRCRCGPGTCVTSSPSTEPVLVSVTVRLNPTQSAVESWLLLNRSRRVVNVV